ncbi:MAG: phosphohydrolase, partial [Anaerolineae bacterium]
MTSARPYRKGMSVEQALCRLEAGAGTQFDAELVGHMGELGRAGDLDHIVGHSADGIPLVTCPHCGPVIAIPRNTKTGDILYCRACHAELTLRQAGNTFEAEMTGMSDDPRNLEPRLNEDAVEDVLAQIRLPITVGRRVDSG